ncbi:protein kinase C and casein kinase substrate in neurons protein 1-like isoform X1 [Daphnia pulex]|uniref:protein kinase C and casein kinase substrate in neurons protein 1-like isoform X1 n=2 Tax=Daphnia pulex TaxID=6669 RepID=UPI001EE01174|nr:protein kinase C and casein kinase substrate in neurons protein 1-like isoform X1 [Daphnia pulex]
MCCFGAWPEMSHHSEENLLTASGGSFWEPGIYKRTTKRIEDGNRLCTDLVQLVMDRAEIEKNYAKNLKAWSKKWNELIEKGPEYGTTEAAWKGVLVESDRLSDLHTKIKDHLSEDVPTQIKSWQKDAYHKSMMVLKEKKEMDDCFKKAQKPWVKILNKVDKAKLDYHNACKAERSASNQERNATGDNAVSPEQVRKLQERVQRAKEEVQRTKEKYEAALQEINSYNPKYMEDMQEVFDKCQQMEAQRLTFFKEVLFNIHKGLNISQDPTLPQIYEELYHTVNNADHDKDLKWWSFNHGVNMGMNWPQFEDYSEEFRDIGGVKGKGKAQLPEGAITLINQRIVTDDLPEPGSTQTGLDKGRKGSTKNAESRSIGAVASTTLSSGSSSGGKSPGTGGGNGGGNADKNNRSASGGSANVSNGTTSRPEGNPFEEEEWDEYPNEALVDNGEPGVPVKALYDYEGAEFDELSFKKGDVFEKLEDEDEQGWCKGRKDGRVGLYPANYVETVD